MPPSAEVGKSVSRELLGVILAGGGSRRFGREKALFPLLGHPMAGGVLEALAQNTADQVVISSEPRIADSLGIRGRPDLIPGAGPLGGLHSAVTWAGEEGRDGVFLMACDLPAVTDGLIRRILARWSSGAPAVVPGSPGPLGFEPLCAGYRTGVLDTVEDLLNRGRRSMEGLLDALGVEPIPTSDLGEAGELAQAFKNVNTKESVMEVEAIVARQARSPLGAWGPAARRRGGESPPERPE